MVKYEIGKVVSGRVTGIEKYGIFVSLDEVYSGLIHISEVADSYVRNIADYANIGEIVLVKILEVSEESNHMKLSIKGINYKNKQKNREEIVETKRGFEPLKEKLEVWIDEKLIQISTNIEKK